MNIMITNVSTINLFNIRESEYVLNDDSDLKTHGVITNEAPIKLMMQKLKKQNEKLDKIIFIVSNKAAQEIKSPNKKTLEDMNDIQLKLMEDVVGKTAVSYLQNKIKKAASEYDCDIPELKEVSISDEPDDKEVVKCIMRVQDELVEQSEKISDNETENIFIEANGGIRYVMVMLTSIMNVLENQYNNIKWKGVLSTIFEPGNKFNVVRDTKSTYISAQLVAAVNEFTNYGRIASLKKYFEMRQGMDINKDNWIMWNDINECINKLSQISEALQLCRSSRILELFYGSENGEELGIKDVLDNFNNKYENSNVADAEIFNYVVDIINKQYEWIYKKLDKDKKTINNLPQVIKWCIEKDYIQQAVTLCSEKVPEYLFKSSLIKMSKNTEKFIKERSSENSHFEYYYDVLISHLKELPFSKIRGVVYYEIICKQVKKKCEYLEVFDKIVSDNYINNIKDKWGEYEKYIYKKICKNKDLKSSSKMLFEVIKDIIQDVYNGKYGTSYQKYLDIVGFDYSNNAKNCSLRELVQKCIKDKNQNSSSEKGMYSKLVYTCLSNKNFVDAVLGNTSRSVNIGEKSWLNDLFIDSKQREYFVKYINEEILTKIYCQYFEDKEIFYSGKNMQDVFLIYGILKEQRNMTNHANIKEKDKYKALNINELSGLIKSFVQLLEEDSKIA